MKILLPLLLINYIPSLAGGVEQCPESTDVDINVVELQRPINPTQPYYSGYSEGYVKIQFEINSNGHVRKAFVIDSKPKHYFDKSAIKAIKSSLFSKDDKLKRRCGIFTYQFKTK